MLEYLGHLRAVHFALIVVCAVTLGSLFGDVPTSTERADRELHQVQQIRSDWPHWFDDWAREQIRSLEAQDYIEGVPAKQWVNEPSNISACDATDRPWQFNLMGSPLAFYMILRNTQSQKDLAVAYRQSNAELAVIPRTSDWPNTLQDFKLFWNNADNLYAEVVLSLDSKLYFVSDTGVSANYDWTLSCDKQGPSSLDLQLRNTDSVCSPRALTLHSQMFCADIPKEARTVAVTARVTTRPLNLSLRPWLSKRYNLQVVGEQFEKDFPELNQVTAQYQNLPFEKVKAILEAELLRSTERLQMIGLTFPLRLLFIAAPIVILAIQLYIWLYIVQLKKLVRNLPLSVHLHRGSLCTIISTLNQSPC